jgi:ribosomal protein S18 acetylase RimI-like enzyme
MEGAFEPGIKICDLSARDKGYGTKLLTMFIDALFRYYGCEKIILDTDMKNERAKHVYEKKLGFRVLGI